MDKSFIELLPNEILYNIAKNLGPYYSNNLAMCSKTMYQSMPVFNLKRFRYLIFCYSYFDRLLESYNWKHFGKYIYYGELYFFDIKYRNKQLKIITNCVSRDLIKCFPLGFISEKPERFYHCDRNQMLYTNRSLQIFIKDNCENLFEDLYHIYKKLIEVRLDYNKIYETINSYYNGKCLDDRCYNIENNETYKQVLNELKYYFGLIPNVRELEDLF